MDARTEAAADFEVLAKELDQAAAHARVTADHFRDRNIPAASAHTVALFGHLEVVKEILAKRAKTAAKFATLPEK